MASQTQHTNSIAYPARLCQHCGCEAKKRDFHSYTAKLKRFKDWTAMSAINTMFFQSSEQEHGISPNPNAGFCRKCWANLQNLFGAYCVFQESRKKDGPLPELIGTLNSDNNDMVSNNRVTKDLYTQPRPSVSIGVQTKSSTQPKQEQKVPHTTSLTKMLREKFRTNRGRRAFAFFLDRTVRTEIRNFSKETMLRNQVEPADDIQLWEKLYKELKGHAPITLAVLNAIARQKISISQSNGSLNPAVGAAFCVLAKTRSQLMNRFQKMVGLILCSTVANKDTFAFLNQVGVSVSYQLAWSNTRELAMPDADDNLKDMQELLDNLPPQSEAPIMDMDIDCPDPDHDSDSDVSL